MGINELLNIINSPSIIQCSYLIEGFRLHIFTNCPGIREVIHTYLSYFNAQPSVASTCHNCLALSDQCLHGFGEPALYFYRTNGKIIKRFFVSYYPTMTKVSGFFSHNLTSISDIEYYQVYRDESHLYFRRGIESPDIWAILDLTIPRGIALIDESSNEHSWGFRQLFLVLFQEIMKRLRLFPLHSAGVSRDQKGFLLAGPAGSGKTTLTLMLVRKSFSFLSDDTLFLRERGKDLEIVSFPEEVKVLDETARQFEELNFLFSKPLPQGADKYTFKIERLYPECMERKARPGMIIFTGGNESPFPRELTPRQAFGRMCSLLSLIQANRMVAKEYFSIVMRLLKETPCIALGQGKTPFDTFERISKVIEAS